MQKLRRDRWDAWSSNSSDVVEFVRLKCDGDMLCVSLLGIVRIVFSSTGKRVPEMGLTYILACLEEKVGQGPVASFFLYFVKEKVILILSLII